MKKSKILLLDLEATGDLGLALLSILETSPSLSAQLHYEVVRNVTSASGQPRPHRTIKSVMPDLIFLILSCEQIKQIDKIFQLISTESAAAAPVIVVIDKCDPEEVLALLSHEVTDFITSPLKAVDILPRVWRLLGHTGAAERMFEGNLREKLGLKQFIGESPAFVAQINRIPIVARCDASVLISGETGTGKDLCARAIHYLSPRADKPFITVNCGALPLELVENELFGHERGAFTGANTTQAGLIHEADGGTLFLDEVATLPLQAQVKLLRFLESKEYRPLGSTKTFTADVRIIAAANVDFEKFVKEGKLRQDLYYRLNIIPFALPPLRERRQDIPHLARYFLKCYAAHFNKRATGYTSDAIQQLMFYDWPGNVRELQHVVERAVVLANQPIIDGCDIILSKGGTFANSGSLSFDSFKEVKMQMIAQFEKAYIQELLRACRGNISQAARAAQKNRRAFWELIRKYQIDTQSFKPQSF